MASRFSSSEKEDVGSKYLNRLSLPWSHFYANEDSRNAFL